MNLRQIRTLCAFLEQGSFSATGDRVGLSHSAVSVQMQQLEDELGTALFDRRSKPPVLTATGIEVASIGRGVLAQLEKMRACAKGEDVADEVSIGFVPTTLQNLLHAVLQELRDTHPQTRVNVKTGMSGELAAAVIRREMDFAILTSPITEMPDLTISEIASEPMYVIGPSSQIGISDDAELALSMPFITFSKRTWLGRQITTRLQSRGIYIDEVMEVDSLETIEQLVADGFGVSIVPQRLLSKPLADKLASVPFCDPVETRKLVLVNHIHRPLPSLASSIRAAVTGADSR